MLDEEKDPIISKIQKLLALSKSPNRAEAEAALNKANEMLLRYNLELEDVETGSRPKIGIHVYLRGRDAKAWRMMLLNTMCKLNFSRFVLHKRGNGFFEFQIVGARHNAVSVAHMADYLFKAVERISREEIPRNAKNKYREAFRYGMVAKICGNLLERHQSLEVEAKALILIEEKEVEEFLDSCGTSKFNIEAPSKQNAYWKGVEAGGKVALHQQVAAAKG